MAALAIQSITDILGQNSATQLSVTGGTSPYTWSIVAGGVGGSVSSSGLYVSPLSSGTVTVKVTDSLSAVVTKTLTVCSTLELVCEIIKHEMGLASDQVYIYNQKIAPIKDERLYVSLRVDSLKPFGVTRRGSDIEDLSVNMQATISIDIVSRTTEALFKKEQVLLALSSSFSHRVQNANAFHISRLSHGFVDLSNIEGASIPYRFNIALNILYVVTNQKSSEYYDTFQDVGVEIEA